MTADGESAIDRTAGFVRNEYDINGIRTVVLSMGSGPELVFFHGTGTFPGFDVARGWATRHKVIIPYHPGFGDSGDAAALDAIDDYVLFYMDLFDRMGLNAFDLAGHSLGGWLAAEFAVRQPQRLRRVVLVAPAGLVVEEAPAPGLFDIVPQELPAYLAHDPAAALRYFPSAPDPAFDARLGREVTSFAKLIQAHPQGNPKLAYWLHRVTPPTLVLWGTEDRLRPTAQAHAWMARLPNATLKLVPATGHLVFEETPAAGRILTDFLAGDAGFPPRGEHRMSPMTAGVTAADEGYDKVVWSILGQTYTLKQQTPELDGVARGVSRRDLRAAACSPDPRRIHLRAERPVRSLAGRQGSGREARRPDAAAPWRPTRHLQQVRRDVHEPVLGHADAVAASAVRPHPSGPGSGRGGSHRRGKRSRFPAAASLTFRSPNSQR